MNWANQKEQGAEQNAGKLDEKKRLKLTSWFDFLYGEINLGCFYTLQNNQISRLYFCFCTKQLVCGWRQEGCRQWLQQVTSTTPSLEPLLEPLLLEPSLPFTISTFTICNLVTSDKPSLWRGAAEKMYVTKNPRDVCVL